MPTATPFVPSWNGQTIYTNYTPPVSTNGTTQFAPLNCPHYCTGDTPSGGLGQSFGPDLLCAPTMSDNYHIHVFIGIYYNGEWLILPEGIGIVYESNPPPPEELYSAEGCGFYYLHTHDQSGVVHVEDPDANGTSIVQSTHTSGDLFTVWGIAVNALQFGPYVGQETVYTSGQVFRGGANCSGNIPPPGYAQNSNVTPESDLAPWMGDPNNIPLYSHEVIWYFIGSGNPTSLPNVSFDEEC